MTMKGCSVEGRGKRARSRGWCDMHYWRQMTKGSLADPRKSLAQRFWVKVDKGRECWLWTAAMRREGYGVMFSNGKMLAAHRLSYEFAKGPIPEGLVIDHLCRVRACVNPAHLEAVTLTENNRRGFGFSGIRARQTECIHGHEFTPENTYITPRGARQCRTCSRERRRAA